MYVCACMCVFCKCDCNAHIYSDLNGKIKNKDGQQKKQRRFLAPLPAPVPRSNSVLTGDKVWGDSSEASFPRHNTVAAAHPCVFTMGESPASPTFMMISSAFPWATASGLMMPNVQAFFSDGTETGQGRRCQMLRLSGGHLQEQCCFSTGSIHRTEYQV